MAGGQEGRRGGRDGEKLSDSGYTLCVELIEIADGLNVAGERKRGIRADAEIYCLNSGKKMELPITKMGMTSGVGLLTHHHRTKLLSSQVRFLGRGEGSRAFTCARHCCEPHLLW